MNPQSESAATNPTTPTVATIECQTGVSSLRCNAERRLGSRCGPDCRTLTPSQAHYSVCHMTFGGVTNFDRHRDNGRCVDPTLFGMVKRDDEVWRSPMPDDATERLRSGRAAR